MLHSMKNSPDKFKTRRVKQSVKLQDVEFLVTASHAEPRAGNRSDVFRTDVSNLLGVFRVYGVNELPPGKGFFLHPIELAKAMGFFKEDAEDPHSDSGVKRVYRLISHVNKKLILEKLTLANYAGAGYRIASTEEAVLEIRKSLIRAFGNALSATQKGIHAVDPLKLRKEDRNRFIEVQSFCERLIEEFGIELEEEVEVESDFGRNYTKRETSPEYRQAKEEAFDKPAIE
jgi:hypothetical protein